MNWINDNMNHVLGYQTKERIDGLTKASIDIGTHLYASNRCAIVHAGGNPTIDQENPSDLELLWKNIPLIQALAHRAIESELGVKSSETVVHEHLYELSGFKNLLGTAFVTRLKNTEEVTIDELPPFPRLSVRLEDREKFDALEKLESEIVDVSKGKVLLRCLSSDQLSGLGICLNFPGERLQINAEHGLYAKDDGTENAARKVAEVTRFRLEYFLNGSLQVWDADRDELLGRCDMFIPVNADLGATKEGLDKTIARWEAEAERRANY